MNTAKQHMSKLMKTVIPFHREDGKVNKGQIILNLIFKNIRVLVAKKLCDETFYDCVCIKLLYFSPAKSKSSASFVLNIC
jgi:hypothetical protein